MKNAIIYKIFLGALLTGMALASPAAAQVKIFFLHHSTGRYIINEGALRSEIATRSAAAETPLVFWDHDYNYIGLRNPAGNLLGYSFSIPNDNTDPVGLHQLWTTANAARDSILANYQVIAFKSCYSPTCRITSDTQLEQYKTWYTAIGGVLSQHPDKIFVIMSPPPLHHLTTNTAEADRARAYANWLRDNFASGRSNCRFFDLFDLLAHPDDGSAQRNMLKTEYELSDTDWHPNTLANQTVAPLLAEALVAGAEAFLPVESQSLEGVKSLYR